MTEAEWLSCNDPTPMQEFLRDKVSDAHCRSDGPHVRGCWALDLLLGKG